MLDLFLDEFGVQFEDGSFDPDSVIVIEGPNHAPQINVGLDLQGRSLEFGELDFFSHLQSEDIMVDDFLGFFEVGNPGQQLIDFSIVNGSVCDFECCLNILTCGHVSH